MQINPLQVKRLICEQFPQWATLPVTTVEFDGWDNCTFRLGPEMSVRLPSAERYAEQVPKEQRWLPHLAPHLPLPIPTPLAMGEPAQNYPWHWSIYRWIEGNHATLDNITNLKQFACDLAQFLVELQHLDPHNGPPPGPHNFFRGGSLATYDQETRTAIASLHNSLDSEAATAVWEAALNTTWQNPTVWIHGNISPTNLLVKDGQLHAVIDFGCMGVGDPACDLAIAWTFFSGDSRDIFRANLPLDDTTWARGRGWALWKALITLADSSGKNSAIAHQSKHVIQELLSDA